MHAHCMYKHVRWRSMHAGTLQRVQEDLTLTRARTLSLTLSRRARRGTRSSSRRRSTRSGRTSTLTRRGRRPSTRPRRRSSLACSTPARYHRRARARCSQPERSPTAPVARPLARGELLGLRGAPLPLPCSCRREGWWRPGAGPKSPIPLRLSTQAQVLGDRALLPRGRPDVPCLLHLLLPLGAVHRRLRPALCTEGRWVALHLPR